MHYHVVIVAVNCNIVTNQVMYPKKIFLNQNFLSHKDKGIENRWKFAKSVNDHKRCAGLCK